MASETEPTVWMRARRWHTYQNRSINEGDYYLAHEHIVETIVNLGFAVRDQAPPRLLTETDVSEPVLPSIAATLVEPRVEPPALVEAAPVAVDDIGAALVETSGPWIDFDAGDPVALHGPERIVLESEHGDDEDGA